jgi:DNA-3-methyladenine glycosylase
MSRTLASGLVRLPRPFYLRPTLTVARDLLGTYLVRTLGGRSLIGKIVEVEAYLGERDPASHAYRGRTRRNDVMFWIGGHLYVYFTYGMHFCANVVTGRENVGEAVLLRALEPISGIDEMARRRKRPAEPLHNLCNGPAKLAEALALAREENGADLCGDSIWLGKPEGSHLRPPIGRSSRVGIRVGREHRWRFYIKDSEYVSAGRPSR